MNRRTVHFPIKPPLLIKNELFLANSTVYLVSVDKGVSLMGTATVPVYAGGSACCATACC